MKKYTIDLDELNKQKTKILELIEEGENDDELFGIVFVLDAMLYEIEQNGQITFFNHKQKNMTTPKTIEELIELVKKEEQTAYVEYATIKVHYKLSYDELDDNVIVFVNGVSVSIYETDIEEMIKVGRFVIE